MPVAYEIHESARVVVMVLTGDVGPDEVHVAVERLRKDPRSEPGFNLLVDARPMLANDFGGGAIRGLAMGPGPVAAGSKRAVLIETDYGFGMSRMFNLNLAPEGAGFAIFRDEDEARRHVGLPARAAGPGAGSD